MKKFLMVLFIAGLSMPTSGCILAAAAGAGYMIHDEATECDDKFDPLEDVRDVEDGCN